MAFLDDNYLIGNEAGKKIYEKIKNLPVVDAHNHANVAEIAANKNYNDVWQLFAATDHYVWEVMRKCGVSEEYITGSRTAREKFLKLAEVFPKIAGNPVYEWIHLDLRRTFGITDVLSGATGEKVWDEANAMLAKPEFRPLQLLMGRLNVEVMCSTDDPVDMLEEHRTVNRAAGRMLVRPTWRPDKAMNIDAPGWNEYIGKLEARFGGHIRTMTDLWAALKKSHDFFAENGAIASDHGVEVPPRAVHDTEDAAAMIFRRARDGEKLTPEQSSCYRAHFLWKCAEFNAEKGWVFQLHAGAVRNVRKSLFEALGPDVGGDISNHSQDLLPGMLDLLNKFDGRLKVVLYCLDPGHQATLATVARAFGSTVRLGSAWWLCDTPIGMKRQLEYVASVDVLSGFAGMVSDSRKLLSYDSRFNMFRRVLSDVLGGMAERGQAPLGVLEELAEAMCYSEPKKFFGM